MIKKRALITGGTGGIGEAIAYRLAKHFHVIIHTHQNIEKANLIAIQIQQSGGSAEVCQFDISNLEQTQQALQALLKEEAIQILVNNAGIHKDVPLAGMSYQDWSKVIDVNLNSFFNVTQPLLLPMMATRWGRIINISSIAGIAGNRGQVNYSAAKAGIHGATRSLALELASRHITVNAIAPGIIETEMSKEQFTSAQIKELVPMQRAGKADEVAALVEFLASDDANYISGQVISINGAML